MARMLPPVVSEHTKSQAEVELFKAVSHELSDDWSVLHSLGLGTHNAKPWAEIDFVLIGPPGVVCLEVKGGSVRRESGRWIFRNRNGQDSDPKAEGPFDQVGSASAALRAYLFDHVPDARRSFIGYGVATPESPLQAAGPDIVREVLYEPADVSRPFSDYMARVTTYWRDRVGQMRDRTVSELSEDARQEIVNLLRGDFDGRMSLRARADAINKDLVRLTEEQYAVLDGLADEDRAIIRGSAGTGKTLLAVEEARRFAAQGSSVLVLCFNRQLADFLSKTVEGFRGVRAIGLHAYMADIVRRANLEADLPAASESALFTVFYPEACFKALCDDLVPDRYDVVIIDEGQDLLTNAYLDVFEGLLNGGLAGGKWRVFYDRRQDMFRGTEPDGLKRVQGLGMKYNLSVNCRNTMPIGISTSMLCGLPVGESLRVDGDDVAIRWYATTSEARRLLAKDINALIVGGFRADDLVVLSDRRIENSPMCKDLEVYSHPVVDLRDGRPKARGAIGFSTVGAFKGLEADAVFLVDVDDLESADAVAGLYVGSSRARTNLYVYLDEAVHAAYNDRAGDFGRRMVGRG
jgi:hypothetical protein